MKSYHFAYFIAVSSNLTLKKARSIIGSLDTASSYHNCI